MRHAERKTSCAGKNAYVLYKARFLISDFASLCFNRWVLSPLGAFFNFDIRCKRFVDFARRVMMPARCVTARQKYAHTRYPFISKLCSLSILPPPRVNSRTGPHKHDDIRDTDSPPHIIAHASMYAFLMPLILAKR